MIDESEFNPDQEDPDKQQNQDETNNEVDDNKDDIEEISHSEYNFALKTL